LLFYPLSAIRKENIKHQLKLSKPDKSIYKINTYPKTFLFNRDNSGLPKIANNESSNIILPVIMAIFVIIEFKFFKGNYFLT